ncbi:uncharacterized protein LOC122503907 [Leptopilina heterotoma]|uniref:uncharacterized protein LOC122503907 n=1 Tax=Leptopilina heterotoma TaxID=63436 RepID=UPI001CA9AEEB|nr:uncharacterized protein LOC122503907 [Leptopilina heterotoma]
MNSRATSITNLPEIKILRIRTNPNSSTNGELTLTEQRSDLTAINRADLEKLLSDVKDLTNKLATANRLIDTLSEELASAGVAPTTFNSKDIKQYFELICGFNKEREELANKLSTSQEETKSIRELFKTKMEEVFRAQAELREPRLMPIAIEGCLNCSALDHSFKECEKPYNGRFCQLCGSLEFSTEECPWPHYKRRLSRVSNLHCCEMCRNPLHMPDINCDECRERMIKSAIKRRNKLTQELEDQSMELKPLNKIEEMEHLLSDSENEANNSFSVFSIYKAVN